ncbi:mechanosensitive ion channel family protein [Reichenbachiella agarivorans]|uniref:Mechanosensitive ion channel family protein n=1 Tax=Reichenbachiella agarivorans TaxID=2979464 RepID=A0ABY6CML9_9BACT|nr:mechanosensitive ion channel family protein [Reichenbachiella agarivorans]UXP31751.1 mechanosensitive ion channel family protein [Reichenbachiella agarivorans]
MNRLLYIVLFLLVLSGIAVGQDSSKVDKAMQEIDNVINTSIKKDTANQSTKSEGESIKKLVDGPPDLGEFVSLSEIFWTLTLIVMGYFAIKFSSRILELLAEKSTQYRITIKSLIPVVKILGWVFIIIIIVMGVFQPPATTILAFSASVGVAVGFASQDILKNIFGGIMILFDRPFNAGDKIEVGDHYGEVVEIGLRSTRILTPDDSLVSIPNGEIMNKAVSNANSGEPNCQVVAEIYLPIDVDTIKVRAIATQAAQVSKYVYVNKPITVIFVNDIKHNTVIYKMRLKAYVLDIRDEFKFMSEMTEIVIKKLIEEGIMPGTNK